MTGFEAAYLILNSLSWIFCFSNQLNCHRKEGKENIARVLKFLIHVVTQGHHLSNCSALLESRVFYSKYTINSTGECDCFSSIDFSIF